MTRLYIAFEPGVSSAVLQLHNLTWCGGEMKHQRRLLLSLSKIPVMAEKCATRKSSIPHSLTHSLTPPKDLKEEIFCYNH